MGTGFGGGFIRAVAVAFMAFVFAHAANAESNYKIVCSASAVKFIIGVGAVDNLSYDDRRGYFQSDVEKVMKQGWSLQGGVSAYRATSTKGWYPVWCQAFVK